VVNFPDIIGSEVEAWRNEVEEPRERLGATGAGYRLSHPPPPRLFLAKPRFFDSAALRSEWPVGWYDWLSKTSLRTVRLFQKMASHQLWGL